MKYPPLGERSWGPTFAFPRHGKGDLAAWLGESNRRTVAFAMIETRAALDALDGILDTPGIDGIFVGPSDFSIAWTNGETVNPDARKHDGDGGRIAARARKAGKHAASMSSTRRSAGRLVGDGLPVLGLRLRASADRAAARKACLARASGIALQDRRPLRLTAATGTARRPSSLPATGHSPNRR